jgi:hypothetical protein
LLEQRELYHLAHDYEQCGSEMVFVREQQEADWLDGFQYQSWHKQ